MRHTLTAIFFTAMLAATGCRTTQPTTASDVKQANTTSELSMRFVKIPKGDFLMGAAKIENGRLDGPVQRRVTISKDFYMQTTEVTQKQWFAATGKNPSKHSSKKHCPAEHQIIGNVQLCPNHPAEQMSWTDIENFLQKINQNGDGRKYRLPTEAEWEYAARGGTSGPYSVAGDLSTFAWFAGNSGDQTQPVGQLKANAYGLYDVHGNVWEWTSDWFSEPLPPTNVTDPAGPKSGSYRVIRGGSYSSRAEYCRSDKRYWRPVNSYPKLGLRLVADRP